MTQEQATSTISASDILSEIDRAVIACRIQRRHAPGSYDPNYLKGIEDGLTHFRQLARSTQFVRLLRMRRIYNKEFSHND